MARPVDTVRIEALEGKSFDRFTSVEIVNDLTAPAEACFEVGDDGTWDELNDVISLGSDFKVFVNDRLRLTGYIQANDVPTDADGGATVRFTVRTKLADAAYASANPKIQLRKSNLGQLVLRAYEPLGLTIRDFIFKADVSRDLMTGRSSRGDKPVDLEALDYEHAKVAPPETIYDFVERHLNRYHLSHWDAPDGRIVIGAPNDAQAPLYHLRLLAGRNGGHNNLLRANRAKDISEAPSVLGAFGTAGTSDFTKQKIGAAVEVPEVVAAGLYRPVLILDEALKNKQQARSRARLEVTKRVKRIDAWELETDGWSYWDGEELVPFGVDTVADVLVDTAGGAVGPYLVHRVRLRLDPDGGFTSSLSVVRKGLWVL